MFENYSQGHYSLSAAFSDGLNLVSMRTSTFPILAAEYLPSLFQSISKTENKCLHVLGVVKNISGYFEVNLICAIYICQLCFLNSGRILCYIVCIFSSRIARQVYLLYWVPLVFSPINFQHDRLSASSTFLKWYWGHPSLNLAWLKPRGTTAAVHPHSFKWFKRSHRHFTVSNSMQMLYAQTISIL